MLAVHPSSPPLAKPSLDLWTARAGYTLLGVCFVTVLISGPDRWAEIRTEYLEHYRGALTFDNLVGNNGYVAALPSVAAYAFYRAPSDLDYGHYFRGLSVLFLAVCLYQVYRALRAFLSQGLSTVLTALTAAPFIHPSTSTFINVAYAGFLPLTMAVLGGLLAERPPQRIGSATMTVLFFLATLSKASFLPIGVVLGLILLRQYRTAALSLVIALAQIALTRVYGQGGNVRLSTFNGFFVGLGGLQLPGLTLFAGAVPPRAEVRSIGLGLVFLVLSGSFVLVVQRGWHQRAKTSQWVTRAFAAAVIVAASLTPQLLSAPGVDRHFDSAPAILLATTRGLFHWLKLQYLTLTIPVLFVSAVLWMRLEGRWVAPAFLALSACSVGFRVPLALSPDVVPTQVPDAQLSQLGYYPCYLNPPFPGFSLGFSDRVAFSNWMVGQCQHFTRYKAFGARHFSEPSDESELSQIQGYQDKVVTLFLMVWDQDKRRVCFGTQEKCRSPESPYLFQLGRPTAEGLAYSQRTVPNEVFNEWRARGFSTFDPETGARISDSAVNFIVMYPLRKKN